MAKHFDPLAELAKTSIQIMLEEPFYGHFFSSLLKEVDPEIDSIGTQYSDGELIKLVLNPEFWTNQLATGETLGVGTQITKRQYGAIKHQVLHLIFKHMLQYDQFGNKALFGMAADMVVNQYIAPDQLELDAITFETFPELQLPSGKTVSYYYQQLKRLQEGKFNPEQGYQAPSDQQAEGDQELQEEPEITIAEKNLNRLLTESDHHLEQHKLWDSMAQLGKAGQKRLEQQLDLSIQSHFLRLQNGNQAASLPAGVSSYIQQIIERKKPQINWRRALRLFTESSSRTYLKQTIKRPSKRYGTNPGIKVRKKQKILVALDTSGSVPTEDLKHFFQEVNHIWKQGVEVRIVECDMQIHKNYIYKGKMPENITGRGGTDFDPPIQFANEKYHPDAIVYFTDGYARPPQLMSRKPILWLISKQGIKSGDNSWDKLPGRKVKMT